MNGEEDYLYKFEMPMTKTKFRYWDLKICMFLPLVMRNVYMYIGEHLHMCLKLRIDENRVNQYQIFTCRNSEQKWLSNLRQKNL